MSVQFPSLPSVSAPRSAAPTTLPAQTTVRFASAEQLAYQQDLRTAQQVRDTLRPRVLLPKPLNTHVEAAARIHQIQDAMLRVDCIRLALGSEYAKVRQIGMQLGAAVEDGFLKSECLKAALLQPHQDARSWALGQINTLPQEVLRADCIKTGMILATDEDQPQIAQLISQLTIPQLAEQCRQYQRKQTSLSS